MTQLHGILPIVNTPFLANGEIDDTSLQRQIDWAFQCGAQGLCTGMVSEILRLTSDERIELTRRLVAHCNGRGAVVMSVGAESTKQAILFAKEAEQAGCSAVMAIPPTSVSLPISEVISYYHAIADHIDLPLIVQDASAYVGEPIPISVCVELLDQYGPNKILFKPEATPMGPHLSALRDASQKRARMFEGSGGVMLVDSYRRGVAGTMPGMEILSAIVSLWNALQRKDEQAVYRLYFPICALVVQQMQAGLDGYIAIEKYLLVKQGILANDHRRRPYNWSLDAETRAEVDRLFAAVSEALET